MLSTRCDHSECLVDPSDPIENYLAGHELLEISEVNRAEAEPITRLKAFVSLWLRELGWTLGRVARRSLGLPLDAPKRAPPRPIWSGPAPALQSGPRVLIDVTDTARRTHTTGIQRVVTEIARAALALGEGLPVVIDGGRLRSYFRHPALPDSVEIGAGDVLLLLDASWNYLDGAAWVMAEAARKRAKTVACVYDVIPLLYPEAFSADVAGASRQWFETVVRRSDAVVAISKTVAEETRALLAGAPDAPNVGWFRLGGDFRPAGKAAGLARVAKICAEPSPFFLSVGTLEPRKGYAIALDAFETLWAAGADARYVIVGKLGWKARALRRRIVTHPEFRRRLFWLNDADDAELDHLYRGARAVVAASFAEGFGLPLVEALQRGAAVIASDIPVFREVAGDAAIYFHLLDAADLARALHNALEGMAPVGSRPQMPSWQDSARELLAVARGGATKLDSRVRPMRPFF